MGIIWLILLLFVIVPLTLFLHELGHSLGALLVKSEKIQLNIGAGKRIFSVSMGRMTIHLHAFYMLGGHTASERSPYYSRIEQAIITLLGPILNGLTGFLLTIPDHNFLLLTFIFFNLWVCFINLIPYRIGSKCSDGFMILKSLISERKKTT